MKENNDIKFQSIEEIEQEYKKKGYICSPQIATNLYLASHLEKPILIEGPAGVGKTELANITASYLDSDFFRLQCYEGLDESKAIYEWKYGKQLLYTQILKEKLNNILEDADGLEASMAKLHQYDDIFFSKKFLEPRPLLKALLSKNKSVLLIDEVDKSDQEFEAYLLEILSDYQISIPEIGTIKAGYKPFVFLTSNNTRELSEALKRRCLHLYIPFPDAHLENEIIRLKVPGISEILRKQLVAFIQQARALDMKKVPSIGETIDWARSLLLLHADILNVQLVKKTANLFLKHEEDKAMLENHIYDMIIKAIRIAGEK